MRTPRPLLTAVLSIAVLAGPLRAHAQPSAERRSFEVASIKPSAPPSTGPVIVRGGVPQRGGGWLATNATLDEIIRAAYPGHDLELQLIGGPSWVRSDRFDITAKGPTDATREQVAEMARNLLADRFGLRYHTETREFRGYVLVFARDDRRLGPGLKRPAVDCAAIRQTTQNGGQVDPSARSACSVMTTGQGPLTLLTGGGLSLGGLARMLGPHAGGQIVDETGLGGLFDVSLSFSTALPVQGNLAATPTEGSSIFTAVQEQLGLKLESRRVPTEVIVIDSVEKPLPN